jgi:FMN phosphatase YigB (HAD superfamily)
MLVKVPTRMVVAFDLDETLGVPMIKSNSIVGFYARAGCIDLLRDLQALHRLILWSVSRRSYVDKVLAYGLAEFFESTFSWDEVPCEWKDVRALGVHYLVDDSPHHREAAQKHGIGDRYIVVPAYGSAEDDADPMAWARKVRTALTGAT